MRGFSLRFKNISPFTRLCLIFFCGSLLLYAIGIGNFEEIYFDELTHVPAARKLIDEGINPINFHPPLNNLFTVFSMMLFGDNPVGWRGLSVLAGALLILGLLQICFRGGLGLARTAYVGCLALSSHFIYVHARLAKPDIFFCALLVWALALLLRAYTTAAPRHKKILLGSSALLWVLPHRSSGWHWSVSCCALDTFCYCKCGLRQDLRTHYTGIAAHCSRRWGRGKCWVFTPLPLWVVICCLICSPRILILFLISKQFGSCSIQFPPSMAIRVVRGNGR